tara:strand:+ start:111 stop:689 length:579 start_codon:yes stop_codon:yes gene_type:complete
MTKKKRELEIGDNVKEIKGTRGTKKRFGEILLFLHDNPGDPTVECAEVDPKELTLVTDAFGNLKKFKAKRSNLKHYVPRKNLFKKETFDVGKCVVCKSGSRKRYGRIMGYLNQEEGLYPNSYNEGKYNGHDLLECVQIDPKPGLHRIIDSDGNPKKFVGYPDKCKLVKVIDTDNSGNPTTKLRLDIPQEGEE